MGPSALGMLRLNCSGGLCNRALDGILRLQMPPFGTLGRPEASMLSSLDDVMRQLYQQSYKKGKGFTGDQWWGAVSVAAGGKSFADFDARYVNGREPYPWSDVLPLAGLGASHVHWERACSCILCCGASILKEKQRERGILRVQWREREVRRACVGRWRQRRGRV